MAFTIELTPQEEARFAESAAARAKRFRAWVASQQASGGLAPSAPGIPLEAFDRENLYDDMDE